MHVACYSIGYYHVEFTISSNNFRLSNVCYDWVAIFLTRSFKNPVKPLEIGDLGHTSQ